MATELVQLWTAAAIKAATEHMNELSPLKKPKQSMH
jgi:hypothetical protein